MANEKRPSLRDFDPYTDRNGQDFGQDSPLDVARPADLQRELASDPGWQAEVARVASDGPRLDAIGGGSAATSDATAAETPPENLRRIADPSLPRPDAADALDRATAPVGQDEKDRP
jgi:hypothetical protein